MAKFTRFTLGMIAVQTNLDGMSREQASNVLRASIDDFSRGTRAERVAARVRALVDPAQNEAATIFDAPLTETLKVVLPFLIRTMARHPLSEAKRWHADIPEAEGASLLDALISLNRRARRQPADMTA